MAATIQMLQDAVAAMDGKIAAAIGESESRAMKSFKGTVAATRDETMSLVDAAVFAAYYRR